MIGVLPLEKAVIEVFIADILRQKYAHSNCFYKGNVSLLSFLEKHC